MAVFGGYGAKQGASGGDIFARMKGGGCIAGGWSCANLHVARAEYPIWAVRLAFRTPVLRCSYAAIP